MRVAVVTGASSGIGEELVRQLGRQGWHTVGLSRRTSGSDEHEECDVSDRSSVDAAAGRVLERHPRIDLLVNNAGMPARAKGFLDVEPERLEQATATNFLGGVWVTRAFLPGLGEGSHLVNVVSVAGEVAGGPYSATKHAQLALSRSLAVELASRGISVLTVKPGFVETPGFPQRRVRFGPLASRLVVDPPFVARRIIDGIAHDRREITVPRWYRPAAVLQALMPATLSRLRSR
ncbi:MAG TPA: SDR family NAD(P)-dependent oxidoreductase [Gaiellaceae bacterium]|nr:SDR family NAD(P)-dependent oxidoreductase [Gaiellaceae bacterium]